MKPGDEYLRHTLYPGQNSDSTRWIGQIVTILEVTPTSIWFAVKNRENGRLMRRCVDPRKFDKYFQPLVVDLENK